MKTLEKLVIIRNGKKQEYVSDTQKNKAKSDEVKKAEELANKFFGGRK